MARERTQRAATVGVAEHGNAAVLVTVARGGELLDRRRVDLTDPGLPTHPHHHEGSWAVGRYLDSPWARPIALADAVALVERVRESAARGARERLDGYDRERVFLEAAAALGLEDVDGFLHAMGRSIGPPWQAKHKLAAAAALAAQASSPRPVRKVDPDAP
ncbi:hypothetical protein [Sorangium cellulosum]|uniref:Uncharacterized protein n=1 Tax=Sorangium cellulosum So0157-2 TaxID=1254432 RepID=S4XQE4_SORCE|nr:hypothetical protein [Sorangium cellulosum]AGP35417.1 hypothetical protein SCE1572_13315 [Sorangium cellulosum So0157-2]